MKNKIAIAISGGIDSLMAAHILKENGHEVFGIHFISGYEPSPSSTQIEKTISFISKQLNIPIEVIDCHLEFKKEVVSYFTSTYQKGETPNPCLVCNPKIKFGTLLDFAIKKGASHLSTGHYANIIKDDNGRYHLYKGKDESKDQSYFLSFLTQTQLSKAYFPLGDYKKSDIKQLAVENKLTPVSENESQDICFIPDNNYPAFLEHQQDFKFKPGSIETIHGKKVGEHKGLHLFTIGQRRGINCPAEKPYYVAKLDVERNVLVVGFRDELLSKTCLVEGINWINGTPPDKPSLFTRLRYRQKETESFVTPISKDSATVEFAEPQFPITPGQGAVFYKNDEILGGGFIKEQDSIG